MRGAPRAAMQKERALGSAGSGGAVGALRLAAALRTRPRPRQWVAGRRGIAPRTPAHHGLHGVREAVGATQRVAFFAALAPLVRLPGLANELEEGDVAAEHLSHRQLPRGVEPREAQLLVDAPAADAERQLQGHGGEEQQVPGADHCLQHRLQRAIPGLERLRPRERHIARQGARVGEAHGEQQRQERPQVPGLHARAPCALRVEGQGAERAHAVRHRG
mmetsp:Transcript_44221/g.122968  ORF Transcript_44221/g.122968 Transcript_44221/m.122968 type:complete len:219 (-) Transcript_44221:291-947(-)